MKRTLLTLVTIALAVACSENKQPQPFSVIPMPNDVTLAEGSFNVAGAPVTCDENLDEASAKAVQGFVNTLETVTGKAGKNGKNGGIHFGLNPNLGAEEYFLQVKPDGVKVEASAFGGFFYAIQTLKQMLPAEVYGAKKAKAAWLLPCVTILDAPRFDYRGIHLDPCRHFWTIEETKRYIDIAAAYKLNRLHWHLTEDQGWRMEIKKYPKLTEVGAWRNHRQGLRQQRRCPLRRFLHPGPDARDRGLCRRAQHHRHSGDGPPRPHGRGPRRLSGTGLHRWSV